MTEFDLPREHQTTAEILDATVGPYTQYALWGDVKQALETILPHLEATGSDPRSYGVRELYPFRHITNSGVRLNTTEYAEHFKNAESYKHDERSYEVQFEPILDEATHEGWPVGYFGFLLDDAVEMAHRYRDSAEAHQPSIEYRRIGAPILVPGEFDRPAEDKITTIDDDESLEQAKRQMLSYMWSVGAHGGETFRATHTTDAIKLCVALANELREVGESQGLSESKAERMRQFLAIKDRLSGTDELAQTRETEAGALSLSVDETGIAAWLAVSPDEPPFIGYRLSQDTDGLPVLESISFMSEGSVNDMDAVVFEQLLRLHTTDWIPFEKWVRELDQE